MRCRRRRWPRWRRWSSAPASTSGVWAHDGDLCAWGTTHSIPPIGLVLEVVEPGLLVVKHHRGEKTGKYVNVAVLEGDQVKLVDDDRLEPARLPGARRLAARVRLALRRGSDR